MDDAELAALWIEEVVLDRLSKRAHEETAKLFDDRAEVWAKLVAAGVEQKEIAERAHVDPSVVSRALSERGL